MEWNYFLKSLFCLHLVMFFRLYCVPLWHFLLRWCFDCYIHFQQQSVYLHVDCCFI
uniref:ATP synthase F0 subunit 8 n=1 Tax=Modiolus modiolus TaxID=40256 RepID=A0A1L7H870_MODMO|nr:ATP synthase F0 subunit 8 [Modiolus modiolus]APU51269.1 ATP synthase F0 subunit 8 [Modiolus modiolus]